MMCEGLTHDNVSQINEEICLTTFPRHIMIPQLKSDGHMFTLTKLEPRTPQTEVLFPISFYTHPVSLSPLLPPSLPPMWLSTTKRGDDSSKHT